MQVFSQVIPRCEETCRKQIDKARVAPRCGISQNIGCRNDNGTGRDGTGRDSPIYGVDFRSRDLANNKLNHVCATEPQKNYCAICALFGAFCVIFSKHENSHKIRP